MFMYKKQPKIIKNAILCLLCLKMIESISVHDFQTCRCGNIHVDGGLEYLKRGYMIEEFQQRPVFVECSQFE